MFFLPFVVCNFATMSILWISFYLSCLLCIDFLYLWVCVLHQFWKILGHFLLKYCSTSILSILFSKTLTGCILNTLLFYTSISFNLPYSLSPFFSIQAPGYFVQIYIPVLTLSSLISNLKSKPSVTYSFSTTYFISKSSFCYCFSNLQDTFDSFLMITHFCKHTFNYLNSLYTEILYSVPDNFK